MSYSFAEELRIETRRGHTEAENTGFIKCLLKGQVDRASYGKLLANFYYIYAALEQELETHRQHPVLSALYYPQLYRRESILQDLESLFGRGYLNFFSPSIKGSIYVGRIRYISEYNPVFLLGHQYTRYLGDLSGGQAIKDVIRRGLSLDDHEGTSFYDFPEIPDYKAFKLKYREILNSLPLSGLVADQIVVEANYAFTMNCELFRELEPGLIRSIGQEKFNLLTNRVPLS